MKTPPLYRALACALALAGNVSAADSIRADIPLSAPSVRISLAPAAANVIAQTLAVEPVLALSAPLPTSIPGAVAPVTAEDLPAAAEAPVSAAGQLSEVSQLWAKSDPGAAVDAAETSRPSGRRAVAAVDMDGNVLGPKFPTQIILLAKNGPTELPVSSAEFAVVEKLVGTDFVFKGVNLKDYEVNKARGSFRNFSGGHLLADMKFALTEIEAGRLTVAEVFGLSYGALQRALGSPETARDLHVITAREHTPAEMLEVFNYMRDYRSARFPAGLIQFAPSIEHLHMVGSAKNVPARKAEVMMELLDELQSSPFGDDASEVLAPDGVARRVLHTVGFSDDTWANYAQMRDALSAALAAAPARWSRIKIVLFYTGTIDPDHALEATVLRPGGIRPYRDTEGDEDWVRTR